eukprot:5571507-Pleurochrysis_carterae.AAC.1
MVSIFRGNRHHVNPSCRSDASDRAARGIRYTPLEALTAASIPVDTHIWGSLELTCITIAHRDSGLHSFLTCAVGQDYVFY